MSEFLRKEDIFRISDGTGTIDYRCDDEKIFAELRGNIGVIRQVLTPSFRKPRCSPP